MGIFGLRRVFTLTSWVVILANPLPIPAFASSEQDLEIKTPVFRQIEAQPTSAASLVVQPTPAAFLIPSTLGSSTTEQTGEEQVGNDSPNDDAPKNSNNDGPKRRALPAPPPR